MKVKKWCKCKEPITCAFNPLTCLKCDNTILDTVKNVTKIKDLDIQLLLADLEIHKKSILF